jgi:ATP-dependent Lon protease
MSKNRLIGLIVVKKTSEDNVHSQDDLNTVGTSALILKMAKTEDNKLQLLAQGLGRFKVKKYVQKKPYLRASVEHIKEIDLKDKEIEALMSNIIGQFTRIAELSPGLPQEIVVMARSIKEPGILADMIASTINSSLEEKQDVLQIFDTKKRLKEVTRLVNHQLEILELGNKIQS